MTQPKTKYKSPRLRNAFVEIMAWVFLVGIWVGIWWAQYRWQLIFTALFAIFIAFVITLVDNAQEKDFNQKQKKEEK